MTATEILGELERRGVSLEMAGDKLRFRPKEALTPDLIEALRQRKDEILAALQAKQPATGLGLCPGPEKCAGCYPIPGGRYIHPPKASPEWKDWFRKWEPKGDERLQ